MLTDNQIVTGDSWGAVKDVLIVSPTFFFCFFLSFIYPLLSPPNPEARLKTQITNASCRGARLVKWIACPLSKPAPAVPLSLCTTLCGSSLPPPCSYPSNQSKSLGSEAPPWASGMSLCTYRVCQSRGGKRPTGPAQLSILSAALYQIRHFSVAVTQDTKYFLSETTLQVSGFRHPHLCWWPRVCKKGSLALLFGGKPCPNCCVFTVDLAPIEDPHCPRRHFTSLLILVGITGRKAPHLDPCCAWLAD